MGKIKKVVKLTLGTLVVAGIIGACTNDAEPTKETAAPKVEQKQEQKKEKTPSKISQENFEKIVQGDALTGEGGMSKDEVIAMLGKPGSSSVTKTTIGDKETTMEFTAWTSFRNGTLTVTFTDGRVSAKSFTK